MGSCTLTAGELVLHIVAIHKNMREVTQILLNVVRCKTYQVGVYMCALLKIPYANGLGGTILALDHVVATHTLMSRQENASF